jgi:UDP:flavonoid glycosyltransferase YjiC (YdhE family)
MLVMPYSHDQPDNGRRVRRLGVAKVVQRKNYTSERVVKMIQGLLSNPRYAERGTAVQQTIASEDGSKTACDALEAAMRR